MTKDTLVINGIEYGPDKPDHGPGTIRKRQELAQFEIVGICGVNAPDDHLFVVAVNCSPDPRSYIYYPHFEVMNADFRASHLWGYFMGRFAMPYQDFGIDPVVSDDKRNGLYVQNRWLNKIGRIKVIPIVLNISEGGSA
ncbi:hypothetical protein COY32_01680 [candidate division WWE3 bacterium CG_4_10_14_0_2_um_filter_41_14]|uniref:Uncharacterized protein n=1 Tax=candidate division WWE3 bacterium CG_4_10_14_0_2_um_filter_41_14 TaxID=1975072 RepID=A0A2M7TKN0_UNCKA|nr:MAG: hypothetical protein COY32_01680 [candidate division WWE3 bacterium CG_4_10_14_0_2_um_filter_41_14]